MKRGGKIFYVLLMAIISFVLFNKFINMEVIDTDHIIMGTNNLSLSIKTFIMAIYVITMVCLPIALAFMMDKIIWPISYGILLAVGVMIGGSEFFQYFIGGTSIPGLFLGAIADVINLVLGIFIADYSGTWLTALGQIVGHLGTVTILASPGLIIETAVADSAKGKKSEMSSKVDSMTSSVLDHDFYGEAKRDYHQQEELEALRRIERNLRGKK